MKKITFTLPFYFSLLLLLPSNVSRAQSGCCVAVNFNDFQSYCIAFVDPCTVGATCTAAALDAAYGVTGDWINITCNTASVDCSAQGCGALPVDLVDFYIEHEKDAIQLHWVTASEVDNQGFEVQRSMDGVNWTDVAFVDAKGEDSEWREVFYSYADKTPVIGYNYYRLRQVDFNGDYEVSEMKVSLWQGSDDKSKLQLAVMPNPATEWITVALPTQVERNSDLYFEIYDQVGKMVKTDIIDVDSQIRIGLEELPSGFYTVKVIEGIVQHSARFVKN